MIDAMFQEGTDKALDDQVQRPRPSPPQAPPGFFGGLTFSTAPRALGAAAHETAAFGAEILGAFGQTMAATDARGGGMFGQMTPAERTQQEQAAIKLADKGLDFSTPAGDELRRRAHDLMPDPETSGLAAQIVGGLFRFGGKAVGYSLIGGPVIGAFGTGADEALTEADKLKQGGVTDLGTRVKGGAVAGVAAGLAVVLPGVGKTLAQTAALVVAGGPVSFMAQQAASRAILEHADYGAIAQTYDPLDPVGLAVSTLIPAGFGAAALRGAARRASLAETVQQLESRGARYGKDGKLLTSPKGAQGEMQVMPGTSRDPGFGVAPARDGGPEELARVGRDYIAAMQRRYGDDAQAMAAYNAGPGAVDSAIKAKGADWLSAMPKETRDYVANGMRRMGRDEVRQATIDDPALVDAARVHQVRDTVAASGLHAPEDFVGATYHLDAVAKASDQMAAGERVNVADGVDMARVVDTGRLDSMRNAIDEALSSAVRLERAADPLPLPRAQAFEFTAAPEATVQAAGDAAAPVRAAADPAATAAPAAAADAARPPTPLESHVERLHAAKPDMQVRLEGMDAAAPARDVVEAVKAEAAQDVADADLLRVAANCFLSG